MLVYESLGFKSLEDGLESMNSDLNSFLENSDITIREWDNITYFTGESAVETLKEFNSEMGVCDSFGNIFIDTDAIYRCAIDNNIDVNLMYKFILKHEEGHLLLDHNGGISYEKFLSSESGFLNKNHDMFRSEARADAYAIEELGLDFETYSKLRIAINNYNNEDGILYVKTSNMFLQTAYNYFKGGKVA